MIMNKKIIFGISIFFILIILNIFLYLVEYKGKWPFKSYIQNINLNVLKDYEIKSGKYNLTFESNFENPIISKAVNNYVTSNFLSNSWSSINSNFYPWENNFYLKNDFDKKKSSFNLDLDIQLKQDRFSITLLQDLYNTDDKKASLIKLKDFHNDDWNLSIIKWLKEFDNNLKNIQDETIKNNLNKYWFPQMVPINSLLYLNFKESSLESILKEQYNKISKESNKESLEQVLIRLFSNTKLKEEKQMSDWTIFYIYELDNSVKDLLKSIYLNNYSLFLEDLYKNLNEEEKILADKIIWESKITINLGINPNYNFISNLSIILNIDEKNKIKFEYKVEDLNWKFISNTKDIKKEEIISNVK